jgi:thiamine pyrophosphate-dependent acetolactate synthase large subunit-like protein
MEEVEIFNESRPDSFVVFRNMTQQEFILNLLKRNKDAIIIGSLGTISKDLEKIPHENKVLIRGAMGCVMGIGLGIALNTKKQVYILIGDGAFLMKMGSLATIARYRPENLHIIILNNNIYASCGGQPTNFKYLINEEILSQIQRCSFKSLVEICQENIGESQRL